MNRKFWFIKKSNDSALKKQSKQTVAALAQLSQSKHAQQCVLVLGQPESGKSSLCSATATQLFTAQMTNSEHTFEIYQRDNTLFLQIPKEFFLLGDIIQQRKAWRFFAKQLKKLGGHYLSITHAIVCIDLYDLLTRSKISNDVRLAQIATALTTISTTLKTPLNALLFFSKADLIPGFNEFFTRQDQEFLQQPWGISAFDQNHLKEKFDSLIKTLNEQLLWRLHQTVHTEHLHLVKAFPLAMENIKHKLADVLPTFLQSITQNKSCEISGLYFISCRQFQELKEREQRKCYFVTQIIETICQTPKTSTLPMTEKISRGVFIVFAGLILLAFISFTAHSFSQHVTLMQKSQQLLQQAENFTEKTQTLPTLTETSQELMKLQKNIDAINKNQSALLIGRFIFSSDNDVKNQLESLYQTIVLKQWTPVITQQLSRFIDEKLETQPEQAYIALKIYLILNPATISNAQQNTGDLHYVATHLPTILGNNIVIPTQLPHNITAVPQRNHIDAVNKWRNTFINLPADKLAYIIFFSNIDTSHTVNLFHELQQKMPALAIDLPFAFIPEIYTHASFGHIYNQDLASIAQEALHGNSVLGAYDHNTMTTDTLLPQLKEEYVQLYCNTWEEAVKHVYLIKTETLSEFIDQLELLTSVKSPILSLLNIVQKNTTFSDIEQNSAFLKDFNNALTPLSTPDNNALFHSFILLQNMRAQLIALQHDGDPAKACALLKQEYAATSQNPTDAQQVRFYATQLPEPMKTWMSQLVDEYYQWINQAAGDCQ